MIIKSYSKPSTSKMKFKFLALALLPLALAACQSGDIQKAGDIAERWSHMFEQLKAYL